MNLIKIHTGAPLSGKSESCYDSLFLNKQEMSAESESCYDSLSQPVLPPTGTKEGPKSPNLLADGFASIAFGYPNANLGAHPKPRCAAAAQQPSLEKTRNSQQRKFHIFRV